MPNPRQGARRHAYDGRHARSSASPHVRLGYRFRCAPKSSDALEQGLMHDEELSNGDIIYNRARVLHARLGRFMQRDPLGYVDGLNAYAAYHLLEQQLDPTGTAKIDREWPSWIPRDLKEIKKRLRCAKGKEKAALVRAKKVLEERARIKGNKPGRFRGRGTPAIGLVGSSLLILLMSAEVADAAMIDMRYEGAYGDDCVVCEFEQWLYVEAEPVWHGYVLHAALWLTVGTPEPINEPTGHSVFMPMTAAECEELDRLADFVHRPVGEHWLGYRARASQYYSTSIALRLPKWACDCMCEIR